MAEPTARRSAFWTRWFRIQYRLIRLADPVVRAWLGRPGLADTVELVTRGRRTGRPRPILLGLLEVDGHWYVGHPNGPAQWTRNLEAAGTAEVRRPGREPVVVRVVPLSDGPERSAAIHATFRQHPLGGREIYHLAHGHIEAVGAFYRLEPDGSPASSGRPPVPAGG
jgi:deazaflavin-dependent oxidoreductase (nitroreductase family)